MKVSYRIIFILIFVLIFAGCGGPGTAKPEVIPPDKDIKENIKEEVIIKAYYEEPLSLKNKDTIVIEGLFNGEEYIEVIVSGEIFDFEQIALGWDEKTNELVEKEIINSIEKIANNTLVLRTILPEGIPSEKLKFKSRSGEIYEYIVQEDGQDGAPNKVTKIEIK